ncbi:MAG: short-chain dehydrogenase/reductase [Marinilabiliales bacterium]|nr:MAG: short-chain dehydrogenase/reductase [Marinilabiliales bacterium]
MKNTILITGATSGIGKATAEFFLEKSWNVIATGRNSNKLEELKNKGAKIIELDVTSDSDINNLITYLVNNKVLVDVLVNNAGFGQFGTIEETNINTARKQFETNVFGLAAISQKIIPIMRKNKSGRIINISSVAGFVSMPGGGWYAASKHAVEAISDSMRWETKQFGIKVSLIEPGPIKTDFAQNVDKTIVHVSDSPYGDLMKNLTVSTDNIKGGTVNSCVKKIYKAATRKKPRNRYLVTKEAYLIKLLISIFPAKIVDLIVIKMFIGKK